jgi:hypothetical protein
MLSGILILRDSYRKYGEEKEIRHDGNTPNGTTPPHT